MQGNKATVSGSSKPEAQAHGYKGLRSGHLHTLCPHRGSRVAAARGCPNGRSPRNTRLQVPRWASQGLQTVASMARDQTRAGTGDWLHHTHACHCPHFLGTVSFLGFPLSLQGPLSLTPSCFVRSSTCWGLSPLPGRAPPRPQARSRGSLTAHLQGPFPPGWVWLVPGGGHTSLYSFPALRASGDPCPS